MRFYTESHQRDCGVDLHARTMYVCILDAGGQVLLHRNFACDPETFLRTIAPFRDGLVVAVECIFTGYWLADLCSRERRRLHFVRHRGQLLAHIQNTLHQYNRVAPGKRIAYRANRDGICEGFPDPNVTKRLEADVALVDHCDLVVRELELAVLRRARGHDRDRYEPLKTVPGIGKALSILAQRIGWAVYFMLARKRAYDLDRFLRM